MGGMECKAFQLRSSLEGNGGEREKMGEYGEAFVGVDARTE